MDATEVTEVCRLCPSSGGEQTLLNVFDQTNSFKYNIRDVIAINTGIEILENDLISKKICQRCCTILYRMFEFRLDALKQDRKLKEKCAQFLEDKGIRLPNTCVTIKKEKCNSSKTSETKSKIEKPHTTTKKQLKRRLHPSVVDVYRNYPNLVLPTKCFHRHIAPIISLPMGEVETYFRKRNLDMKKFIYKPRLKPQSFKVKGASFSPKQKTVAPLKISKKLLENHEGPDSSSDSSYICTTVSEGRKRRKRNILSTDSERSVESKAFQSNQVNSLSLPKSIVSTPEPTISESTVTEMPQSVSNLSSCTSNISPSVRIPSPQLENLISQDRATSPSTPSPTPTDPVCIDSRTPSPVPSTSSMISTSSGSKPEFIEFLGLTSTITTTKTHTLLVCNLCGSVHHNSFELKRHTRKHMVCQFCKHRFKSIETKQYHVDNLCQIKKIMNSSGPVVALEKIHLNLDVRKKYKDAFGDFELIPGLVEPAPVEHVIIKASSPPPPVDDDNVIVLSDEDDEIHSGWADPLSGIPTPSVIIPPPAVENIVYNTVSIVKPDIRIKYNTLLNGLVENLTDKQLVEKLITLVKPEQVRTTGKMLQTNRPANTDIIINNSDGTCEFKHLKTQLLTYKVPITVSSGPFRVTYQFENTQTKTDMALWNDLPLIDVDKEAIPKTDSETKNILSTVTNCPKSQSLNATLSLLPATTISTTNSSNSITPTVSSSFGFATQQNNLNRPVAKDNLEAQTLNNANVNSINTLNSATPLLQNYALSITAAPVTHSPIPIPRTYINSALNNTTTTSNRTISSPISNNLPSSPLIKNYSTTCKSKNVPVINSSDSSLLHVSSTLIQPQVASSLMTITSTTTISRAQSTYSSVNIFPLTAIIPVQSICPTTNIPTPTTIDPVQSTCPLTNIPSPLTTTVPAQSIYSLINISSSSTTLIPTQSTHSLTNISPSATNTPAQVTYSSTNITTSTISGLSTSSTEKNTTSSPPPVIDPSKFRVKNIWELQ